MLAIRSAISKAYEARVFGVTVLLAQYNIKHLRIVTNLPVDILQNIGVNGL